MQLNSIKKDTGKFWSFKDTYSEKEGEVYSFNFKKPYLLKVLRKNELYYTIPVRCFCDFNNFKNGFYIGLSDNKSNTFKDHEIK